MQAVTSPALALSKAATAQAEGDFGSALCRYPTKARRRAGAEPRAGRTAGVRFSSTDTTSSPHVEPRELLSRITV